eukprot:TRINITY_DN6438_c0_g1_i1.p1 TRINITY_DN6438_c0_g1~~TRINITY_DN6438_c0_g1_i1.p1  ORF type:complete len:992 (-),score=197.19 TRINITY_DN6438_c0_g1_i1:78-3053(-)
MSRERYQNERRDQNGRYVNNNNNPHAAGRNNLHRRPSSTDVRDLRQSKQGSRPGLPHCNNFQNHGHCNESKTSCPYFHEGLDCVKHFKYNRCDYSGGQRNCRYQHRNVRKAIMPREEPDRLSLKSNDLRLSITRSSNQLDPNIKPSPNKPNSTSNPTESQDPQPDTQPVVTPTPENEPTATKDPDNQSALTLEKTLPEEKESEIRDNNLEKLQKSNEIQPNPTQSTENDNEIKPKSDETVEGKEFKSEPLKEPNANERGNHKFPLHNGEKKKEEYGDLRDEVRESIEAKEARFGRGDFRGDDRDFRRDERRNDRRKNWRRDESPHSKSRNSQKYFPQRSVYQNSKNAIVEDHSRDIPSAATISINEPGNTILTAARENNEKKATRTAEELPIQNKPENDTNQAPPQQAATVSPAPETTCEVKAEPTTKPAEVTIEPEGGESVWKQYYNSTGVPFYYNAITKESKWNKPDEPNQQRSKPDEAEDRSKYPKNERNERDSKYFKDKQQDRYREYPKNDNYDLRYSGDLRENYSSRGSEDRTKTEYNETLKSEPMKDNLIKSDRNDGISSRDRLEEKPDTKKDFRSRKALPDKRRRSLERVDRSLSRPPNKYDERKHIKRDPPPRDTGDLRDTLVLPSNLSPNNYRKRHRSDPPYYSIKRFKDHHNPPTSPNYHRGSYPVHHDLRDELREDLRFNTGYRPYGVFYQKSMNYAGARNQSQYSRAFGRNINRNSKDDNREKLRAIRYHPGRPYNEGPRDHRDLKRSGREGKGRDRRNRADRERMPSKDEKEEKEKDNERESGKANERSERNEDVQSKNHYQKVLAKMIVHENLAGDLFEYVKNARKAVIENNPLLKNELTIIISKPMEEQRPDQLGQTNSTFENENVYANELDQQKEDLNPPYYLSDEYDNEYDHIKDQTMETIKQSINGFEKLFVPSFLEDFKDPLYSYSNVVLKNIGLKVFSSDIYTSSLNQFRETIGLNELSEDDDFIETMELY